MSNSVKDIKRKIKSIRSTRQITKAMELVATSKMKKAVDSALRLRIYGYMAFQILARLSENSEIEHLYFKERTVKNLLVLLFTSDKGLCGGLNANLFKKILKNNELLKIKYPDAKITYAVAGKKGAEFLKRMGMEVTHVFPAYTTNPKFSDTFGLSNVVIKGFKSGNYDKVMMVYPDYVSTLLQKPVVKGLLPFSTETFKEMLDELGSKFSKVVFEHNKNLQYKLEPSESFILDNVVPQLVEVQLFQALLEMTASEHSARMMAMQNATQAATDLLDNLTLTYNQARQAAITQEIAEIAASSLTI